MHTPALIPQPRASKFAGGSLTILQPIAIDASGGAEAEARLLAEAIQALAGTKAAFDASDRGPRISLRLDEAAGLPPEGYRLRVDSTGASIAAVEAAGLFYGIQTLLQLVQFDPSNHAIEIPYCEIEDSPSFSWRGLHLDVARHFMPLAFVKKLVDAMAMHKLNVLHWHLTDDQGWRVEIDAFPKLTEIGATRPKTLVGHSRENPDARRYDDIPHEGFYRKDEIRDIVAYAAARHIIVVPEIEMPGHALSVLACYPELSCMGGPFEVTPLWGVHKEVFCAGNDEVFSFFETVLDEVLALFPSPFIHVGGDECPKDRWKACPKCQARIREGGLADEHELQSWFIRRMERFLSGRGRRLIGWDEILEGGLPAGATVMSWRGEEGGIEAARAGHDVVMCPQQSTYFDYYQADPAGEPLAIGGMLPLRKVYEFNPIPAALSATEAKHVLGTQGLLWTEYMPNLEHVEYMAFPRTCAMAEVAWGTSDATRYDDFTTRLSAHLKRLDRAGIRYRPGF